MHELFVTYLNLKKISTLRPHERWAGLHEFKHYAAYAGYLSRL